MDIHWHEPTAILLNGPVLLQTKRCIHPTGSHFHGLSKALSSRVAPPISRQSSTLPEPFPAASFSADATDAPHFNNNVTAAGLAFNNARWRTCGSAPATKRASIVPSAAAQSARAHNETSASESGGQQGQNLIQAPIFTRVKQLITVVDARLFALSLRLQAR